MHPRAKSHGIRSREELIVKSVLRGVGEENSVSGVGWRDQYSQEDQLQRQVTALLYALGEPVRFGQTGDEGGET